MKKLIFALLALCLAGTACRDKEPTANLVDTTNLVNTKWKLVGIVDAKTGVLTELEPKDCDECYTLAFDTDSTLSGFSTTRIINGEYSIDYTTNSINILMHPLIALEELNLDAELYVEDLRNVFSFSLQENNSKLRIYFNTESYFLYNKLSQP